MDSGHGNVPRRSKGRSRRHRVSLALLLSRGDELIRLDILIVKLSLVFFYVQKRASRLCVSSLYVHFNTVGIKVVIISYFVYGFFFSLSQLTWRPVILTQWIIR